MPKDRMKRVNELLKREISGMLFTELNDPSLDVSVLTVTRVDTTPDLREARVYVSVRGDDDTRERAMRQLRRRRTDIQRRMSEHVILKYTPRLQFKLDRSLEKGDRVLGLLAEIGMDDTEPTGEEDEQDT